MLFACSVPPDKQTTPTVTSSSELQTEEPTSTQTLMTTENIPIIEFTSTPEDESISIEPTIEMTIEKTPFVIGTLILEEPFKINDLYFETDTDGWAVGEVMGFDSTGSQQTCCTPLLLRTIDSGQNWDVINIGIPIGVLNSINVNPSGDKYIVGYNMERDQPIILRLMRESANWEAIDSPEIDIELESIIFNDKGKGWAVGSSHASTESIILVSENGDNWNEQPHPTSPTRSLTAVLFPSNEIGFLIGFEGAHDPEPIAMRTTNEGEAWNLLEIEVSSGKFSNSFFLSEQIGFLVGQTSVYGLIARTENGGESWSINKLDGNELQLDWIGELNNHLVLAGKDCQFDGNYICNIRTWVSTDYGKTWHDLHQFPGEEEIVFFPKYRENTLLWASNSVLIDENSGEKSYVITFFSYSIDEN